MRTIAVGGQSRPYFDLFAWIAPATLAMLPATTAPVAVPPVKLTPRTPGWETRAAPASPPAAPASAMASQASVTDIAGVSG